ncbi:LrgB family protein [Paenibacillus sp. y28]|uniref:LrgB family protein n=1 Tax=Paenibacillus sp. y28 TaxID=3129110 RepID=UPI00301759C3
MTEANSVWLNDPLFGLCATILAYTAAQLLNKRWPWLHPLFVTSLLLIGLILFGGVPYEAYRPGGEALTLLLGPATVALAVPLYKNAARIKRYALAICSGITIGSLCGIVVSAGLVWMLGGPQNIMLSVLAKSVTAPVSIELTKLFGGLPGLAAVMTVLTGLLGSMIGPALLRLAGVREDIAIGSAVGTAAHGIGTSRVIRESELQGGVSGFAMGLAAIITSVLVLPLYWWLQL